MELKKSRDAKKEESNYVTTTSVIGSKHHHIKSNFRHPAHAATELGSAMGRPG
jgi:hypothetical protein